jgi:hypothetical protein
MTKASRRNSDDNPVLAAAARFGHASQKTDEA